MTKEAKTISRDSLGDRMKRFENIPKLNLIPRTPVIIRVDGKAFHTLTRNLEKPFCEPFQRAMQETAAYLCQNVQGAQIAYVQSDEISLLLTDYETHETQAWFGYQLQKLVSVSASLATAYFNLWGEQFGTKLACFDSRAWNISREETANYFLWRQQDAVRNSIQSVAQANFSQKELHGLNCNQLQEKLFQEKGINWNDLPIHQKRGACVVKEAYVPEFKAIEGIGPVAFVNTEAAEKYRNRWKIDLEIPTFTQNREYIENALL